MAPTMASLPFLSLLLLFVHSCHAVRDASAPWGDNPPRRFDMYWREPGNVLEDLDQFDSLYVRSVGCMWSEYGYNNYDDDGENRDGDEHWYEGRTTSFRANTAYSLYGIKRGPFSWLAIQKCARHTYINTFITTNGADALLNVTGRLSADDDFHSGYGHGYCYGVNNDDDHDGGRWLENNDDDDSVSETMGCSLEGHKYAMATFQGGYCDGMYFLEITDEMQDYNRKHRRVRCDKVWDYSSAYKGGQRVDTPADTLLEQSSSCSNTMYDGRCPDPYGMERAYRRAVSRGGGAMAFQTVCWVISWMALVLGVLLMAAAYYARHKRRLGSKKRVKRSRRRDARRQRPVETPPPGAGVEISETSDPPSSMDDSSSAQSQDSAIVKMKKKMFLWKSKRQRGREIV